MNFSLFYFDGDGSKTEEGAYNLLLDSAKFADQNGFVAVWTPERHFHAFGGLYPSPSVISSALAMVTDNIQLRSGSVVLPLQHPVRVAEEWGVIDNLSNGRVGLGFASGWTMDEFILSKEAHGSRRRVMWENYEQVKALWEGEQLDFEDATGRVVTVQSLPRPLQPNLPAWIAVQSMETFIEAGRRGANILCSLLGETLEEAAPKIAAYRQAREKAGLDPDMGKVTMMLHTFMGDDMEQVRKDVHDPFCDYLRTHVHLLNSLAKGMGLNVSIEDFSEDDVNSLLEFGVDGFIQGRALIGTPESCVDMVEKVKAAGVDEIACLIDFVQDYDLVMGSLPFINELKDKLQGSDNSQVQVIDKEALAI